MTSSRHRSPWEVPDCPNGHDHLFVGTSHQKEAYECFKCGEHFDNGLPHENQTAD